MLASGVDTWTGPYRVHAFLGGEDPLDPFAPAATGCRSCARTRSGTAAARPSWCRTPSASTGCSTTRCAAAR
jgi:hypothetical protein